MGCPIGINASQERLTISTRARGKQHVHNDARRDVIPDDLDTLREGWDFEAKLAAGRDGQGVVPESLWETYSAMANTEGGVIVLGAKELPDGSLQLHGIVDIEKVERDLWNLLQNPQKVSANLLRRDDVRRVELDGRALLVIQVP